MIKSYNNSQTSNHLQLQICRSLHVINALSSTFMLCLLTLTTVQKKKVSATNNNPETLSFAWSESSRYIGVKISYRTRLKLFFPLICTFIMQI